MTVLNEANKIYIGSTLANKVFAGANQVWPKKDPGVPITSGLVIHLDASQLSLADGAMVSAWPNKGSGPATTFLDSLPLAVMRANALNGKGVVRLGAGGTRIRFTGTGVNRDFTMACVVRVWGVSGRVISSKYPEGGNILLGYWTTFMDIGFAGTFFTPDHRQTTNNEWRLYSAWANSATPEIRLYSDGVFLSGQGSSAYSDTFGGTFNISGFNDAADESCDCEIAEVLFYNRMVTDPERVQIEDYLHTKWLPPRPPRPWTPADLGPSLLAWFDGGDASTITITGSGISAWRNKGVGPFTLTQWNDAWRPQFVTNYMIASGFQWLQGTNSPPSYDFFVVGQPSSNTTDFRSLFITSDDQNVIATVASAGFSPGDTNGVAFGVYSAAWGHSNNLTWPAQDGLAYGQVTSGSQITLSRDGGVLSGVGLQPSTTNTGIYGFGSSASYAGGNAISQAFGRVYEFVLVPFGSAIDVRQKLEGYSAWKWNLQGLLPSNHPYKTAAPMV